jgi:hypothetical protein
MGTRAHAISTKDNRELQVAVERCSSNRLPLSLVTQCRLPITLFLFWYLGVGMAVPFRKIRKIDIDLNQWMKPSASCFVVNKAASVISLLFLNPPGTPALVTSRPRRPRPGPIFVEEICGRAHFAERNAREAMDDRTAARQWLGRPAALAVGVGQKDRPFAGAGAVTARLTRL